MSNFIYEVIAIAATAIFLPKLKIDSILGAIGLVLSLSLVNQFLWNSELFSTIPDTIGQRELVLVFCNGVIFFVLSKLLPGIKLEGIVTAFIAPLLFSLFTILIQKYGHLVDWQSLFSQVFHTIQSLKANLFRLS